ncbi:MAG: serine--tRNA ligase, partial [Pseudomonadota bacterium]
MFDIKWIRENPVAFDRGLERRGLEPHSARLIEIDDRRKANVAMLQEAQTERNAASKEIGKAMAAGDKALAEKLKADVSKLKDVAQSGEQAGREITAEMTATLEVLPNLPLEDVPDGEDEAANIQSSHSGEKPEFAFEPKEHFEIGENLGQMDFETAARIAGSRFTILNGGLARMERALGQFMLDMHTQEHGYLEVQPPLLVNDQTMYGTGQLPKFSEDLFLTTDQRWLIPTAEVPLTNMVAGEIVDHDKLPMRFTALTPCFRSEAGSAGRDTRGMLRQHQFNKVELVSVTTQETSLQEHERMLSCAEA